MSTRPLQWVRMLATCLLSAACAGGRGIPPMAVTPAPVPDTSTMWWRQFGAPALDTLVATAVRQNADIQRAIARLAESRATAFGTSGNWEPTVAPTVDLSRAQQVLGTFGAINTTVTSLSTRASWEVDLFGRLKQERLAANADRLAATYDLDDVRRTTVAQVVRGYFDVVNATQQLAALEAQRALRRETRQLEATRARAGLGAATDSVQADASEQDVLAQVPAMHAQRATAIADLSTLTGRTIAWVDSLLGRASMADRGPTVPDTGISAAALARRPDVRAAETRMIAAAARMQVAVRALRPSLSLSGTIGRNRTNNAGFVSTWSFGPTLALTIPTKATRAQVGVRGAQLAQQEIAWRRAVHDAASDAELAFVQVRHAGERLEAQRRLAATYRDLASLSRSRYRSGLSDLRDVLEVQQKQLAAERTMIEQWTAYAKAVVTLYQATGWAAASA